MLLLLLLLEDFARFFTGADDEVMSDVRATCQGHHCFTRQPTPVLHTYQLTLDIVIAKSIGSTRCSRLRCTPFCSIRRHSANTILLQ